MKALFLQTSCSNIFPLHALKQALRGDFQTQHFKIIELGQKKKRQLGNSMFCVLWD